MISKRSGLFSRRSSKRKRSKSFRQKFRNQKKQKHQFEKLEQRNLLAATVDNPIFAEDVTVNIFTHDATGETRGEVFHDWNRNGIRERYDTQLSNWFVFVDRNNNDVHDATENYTRTDKNGTFILNNVSNTDLITPLTAEAEGTSFTVTPEMRVNTTTHRTQAYPGAATSDNGSVVVWASKRQDGHNFGIFGQRFDSNGAKVGGEFQINTTTHGPQTRPSVDAWSNGRFVVTWQSHVPGQGWNIYSQLYSANGTKLGQERLINKTKLGQQKPARQTDRNARLRSQRQIEIKSQFSAVRKLTIS